MSALTGSRVPPINDGEKKMGEGEGKGVNARFHLCCLSVNEIGKNQN